MKYTGKTKAAACVLPFCIDRVANSTNVDLAGIGDDTETALASTHVKNVFAEQVENLFSAMDVVAPAEPPVVEQAAMSVVAPAEPQQQPQEPHDADEPSAIDVVAPAEHVADAIIDRHLAILEQQVTSLPAPFMSQFSIDIIDSPERFAGRTGVQIERIPMVPP